jgi:hypothetical protein
MGAMIPSGRSAAIPRAGGDRGWAARAEGSAGRRNMVLIVKHGREPVLGNSLPWTGCMSRAEGNLKAAPLGPVPMLCLLDRPWAGGNRTPDGWAAGAPGMRRAWRIGTMHKHKGMGRRLTCRIQMGILEWTATWHFRSVFRPAHWLEPSWRERIWVTSNLRKLRSRRLVPLAFRISITNNGGKSIHRYPDPDFHAHMHPDRPGILRSAWELPNGLIGHGWI